MSLSARARADTLGYFAGRHSFAGATGEARKWIMAPDEYEPLGFAISEYLAESAHARRRNLVACVPDEAFELMRGFTNEKGEIVEVKPSGLLRSLGTLGAEMTDHGEWMTVRPKLDSVRLDRHTLASLLRQEERDGCLRLSRSANLPAR